MREDLGWCKDSISALEWNLHGGVLLSKLIELKNCLIAATKYGQIGNKISPRPRLRRNCITVPYYFTHDDNYKKLMEKYNKENIPSSENFDTYKNEVDTVIKEIYEKGKIEITP